MVSKIERFRRTIQEARVLDLDELHEEAKRILGRGISTQHLHTVYLKRLQDEGWLQRPRQGLFVATHPEHRVSADPYLIASKIRTRSYLGYHTALELHGSAYTDSATKYVVLDHRDKFRAFTYQGITYRPVLTRHHDPFIHPPDPSDTLTQDTSVPTTVQRMQRGTQTLRVSTPSRTVIDCVARPALAGGWETCLKSLAMLSRVEPDQVISILAWMDQTSLWSRVGYVIELLQDQSPYYARFTADHLEALQSHVPSYPEYLDHEAGGERNTKWNLYVPSQFETYLEGV